MRKFINAGTIVSKRQCKEPECYKSFSSNKEDKLNCHSCKSPMDLYRHISFVDCPGHDILMATMLTGAAVMDACLLLIAGTKSNFRKYDLSLALDVWTFGCGWNHAVKQDNNCAKQSWSYI